MDNFFLFLGGGGGGKGSNAVHSQGPHAGCLK